MANYVKLVVLVVTLMVSMNTVRGQDGETTAPPIYVCKVNNEAVCGNCRTPVFCGEAAAPAEGEAEAPVYARAARADDAEIPIASSEECPSGKVCEVLYGTPVCVAISSTTKCQCNKPSQCDAHNPNDVFSCAGSNPIYVQQCAAGEKCNATKCEGTPEAEGGDTCEKATADGWNLVTPACKSAAYCVNKESKGVSECGSGEYFDLVATSCAAAPPGLCGDSCSGACPDLTNCASYDVCDGNGNSVHSMPCPDGQLFDPERRRCVAKADQEAIKPAPACVPLTECVFPPPLPALSYLNRRYAAKLL